MPRRKPSQIIGYWAPRLGLDPRAVKTVAMGEGGLRWGAEGDGGHAFGPFQMNDAGGVLTGRFGSSAAREAYANSEPGMVEAMRAMARAGARGQRGMEAVSTIISKYERPADIPGSIAKARARWGDFAGGGSPPTNPRNLGGAEQSMPSSPVFGLDASTSGVDSMRKAAGDFFKQRAHARLAGAPTPGIAGLASVFKAIREESEPVIPVGPKPVQRSPRGEIPSTARPRGQTINNGPGGMPFVIQAGEQARRMGLSVRENPYYDDVDPVHTEGSDHYDTIGSYRGKQYGAALDVSGDPEKTKRFFRWLEARKGNVDDLFYTPMGYSYDEGKRWEATIPKHKDHLHVSVRR